MISEWARAVNRSRQTARKEERITARIDGGNYARPRKIYTRKKSNANGKKAISESGLGGGAAGTPAGPDDRPQNVPERE